MEGVDPPGLTIGRREALTASTLGIGSLLLPAAGAAASPGTFVFEPSAFTYTTETVVAAWLPFDSADEAAYGIQSTALDPDDEESEVEQEFGPGVVARRVDRDGLKAYLTIGGTGGENGDPEVTGKPGGSATSPIFEPIDLTPSFSEWRMHNSVSVITLEATPHLDFTINVMSGQGGASGTLTLATLVLHSVSNMTSAPNNAVNLAAYVTTAPKVGAAQTVLRRTASIPDGTTNRHIVINLGLSGRSFTGGDAVTVRIYPYATDPARDEVRFRRFNSDPAPQALTAADVVDDRVNAILDGSQNWMAAFIGTYDPPPDSQGSDGPQEDED
jgi:hypothetical protein